MKRLIAQLNGLNVYVASVPEGKQLTDFEIKLFNKGVESVERVLQKGLGLEKDKWVLL